MPRVKTSASDAVFCEAFLHRMHTLSTWGFSSIQVYDKVCLLSGLACLGAEPP